MSVFKNDPFGVVYEAFCNLYPDRDMKLLSIEWMEGLKDDDGNDVCGCTTFTDNDECYVYVSADIPVSGAVETLAHELAHVAVGERAQHGPEWEKAFDQIYNEYNRIMKFDLLDE